jgi:2,5-diketo-D-gluconate reductase A
MPSKLLPLNDGRQMPQFGFGVWQVPEAETAAAVTTALETGFRLIDTAAGYGNEAGVGVALRNTSVPREAVFVTTKLANSDHGTDEARRAFDKSMGLLGFEYVDLYLIHWPVPSRNRFVDTWKTLIELKATGRIRSIGVSNFTEAHLQRLFDETGVVPTVNQIELQPRFQQHALSAFDAKHGIVTQSWSPLGRGRLDDDPVIGAIAAKHGRTWAQVVLRWHLDQGLSVVTKSVTPSRIRENYAALDFALDADDMAKIAALDDAHGRMGPNPERLGG